jgi:hypothetical protein
LNVRFFSQYEQSEAMRITEAAQSLREMSADVDVRAVKLNCPDGDALPGNPAFAMKRELHDRIPVFRVPPALRGRRAAVRLALNCPELRAGRQRAGPVDAARAPVALWI